MIEMTQIVSINIESQFSSGYNAYAVVLMLVLAFYKVNNPYITIKDRYLSLNTNNFI
jgi:hypothetical protein